MIRKVDGNFVQLIKPYLFCCPTKSCSKWLKRGEQKKKRDVDTKRESMNFTMMPLTIDTLRLNNQCPNKSEQ